MSSRTVPVTFTFRRQGVSPPVFVVGSFSSPPWQPVEMDHATDDNGDFNFTKEVMVDESSEIQYKYRIGSDEWILDPNADTFTEEGGNVNSFVRAPVFQEPEEKTVAPEIHVTEVHDAAADQASDTPEHTEIPVTESEIPSSDTPAVNTDSSTLNVENDEPKSSPLTPIEEVAQTAAEVADTAAELDDNVPEVDGGDDALMLSHERFASSDDNPQVEQQESSELQNDSLDQSDAAEELAVDYDDPRLERFPSDRSSIIATMRRLSTNVDPDSTLIGTPPLSPVIAEQQAVVSDTSLPLDSVDTGNTNPEKHEVEDVGRSLETPRSSIMSLQSITEGEEVPSGSFDHPAQYVGPVEPHDLSLASADSSNEDEGISMGDSPARNKKTVDNTRSLADTDTVNNVTVGEEQTGVAPVSPKAEEPHDKSNLQKPANGERSQPPGSSHSAPSKEKGQWLRNFLRTIFVDWISGIFGWLVGRDRSEVKLDIGASSRIGAVVILGAGISLWALQDRLPSLGLANSLGKST